MRQVIGIRLDHAVLRSRRFLNGMPAGPLEVKDVTWIHRGGEELNQGTWCDEGLRAFGMLLDGRAWPPEQIPPDRATTLLILFNAHHEDVGFVLPAAAGADPWLPLLDTAADALAPDLGYAVGATYRVAARSLVVCTRAPGLTNVVATARRKAARRPRRVK